MTRPQTAGDQRRFAFCIEQTLGHRAHTKNLTTALERSDANIDWHLIDYRAQGRLRVPWAVAGSWQAAHQVRTGDRRKPYDAAFFHTQCLSLFAPLVNRGTPFVVSLDATPVQVDTMGAWYNHDRGSAPAEGLKSAWYRAVFRRAAGVVTWSQWAADSLRTQYGVPASAITVAHPGAGETFFSLQRPARSNAQPTILFVGGDFLRKGGDTLLDAFRALQGRARLTLVTSAEAGPVPDGVTVIRDATPGSPQLLQAYAEADLFCLPTRGDCTSVAIEEAMAGGLPVVTTNVGSNAETVQEGAEGLLIPPGDVRALITALDILISDGERRGSMGAAARKKAALHYDASANARRIVALMEEVAA